MTKVGPNEKCPCGSGLKYKRCYKNGTNCKIFQRDELKNLLATHQQKEKEIVEFLTEAVDEVKGAFFKNEKGNDVISPRIQLIVCFSIIDVFASYWHCYTNNLTTTPSIRFNTWLEEFCFTENNKEYKKEKFGKLDIELLSKLRNSMVHFFAIPNIINPGIVLTPNSTSNEIIKFHKQRLKNKGVDMLYLKPIFIKDWLVNGAQLMLNEMIKNITLAKTDNDKAWQHIYGIDRIYKKTQLEGAKKIDIEKYNKV